MRRLAACLLALVALAAGCGPETPVSATAAPPERCPGAGTDPFPAAEGELRAAILCLVNEARVRHGARPLVEDRLLERAAAEHSDDMGRRDFFEHRTPDGVEPWMRIGMTGYRAALVGENLAWGEAAKGRPSNAMALWLTSPGHRRNLLEPRYTQIGIGIGFDAPEPGRGQHPAAVYTTTFGSAPVAR